jgi:Rne/Rng family ribonuclease
MNKELYVSSTPHETRVALTEDDQLAEIFFERENEYTLAGSIYKGRVTRVLPGMQSAFVDIGLERDAFLYVSDFLEVGEEEDEEFGEIPAPRGTIDLRGQQPATPALEAQAATAEAEEEYEAESGSEDYAPPDSENGKVEAAADDGGGEASGEESESAEGARPWRGRRRRRGGRRGHGDERLERSSRPESTPDEPSKPAAEAPSGPPPGYNPMVLPGESISKYRDLAQHSVAEIVRQEAGSAQSLSAQSLNDAHSEPQASFVLAEQEEAVESSSAAEPEASELEHGHTATEPEQLEWAAAGAHQPGEEHGPHSSTHAATAEPGKVSAATTRHDNDYDYDTETVFEVVERKDDGDDGDQPHDLPQAPAEQPSAVAHHRFDFEAAEQPKPADEDEWMAVDFAAEQTVAHTQPEAPLSHEHEEVFPSHAAPSTAPEGRTLEHETLDEEEMEFPPVPEDIEALSEAAADSDLDLIEETIDAGNGYGDRWLPKIADVDEEEVLAAEMRGETYQMPSEDEEDDEEEETNGRAEVRAASPTVGYQQRQSERGYERRGQRGRRGNRRNNVRTRTYPHRQQPLITELLKEGQEILVQIAKEPINKKGARITSHIALPGRFLVYMPTVNHVGVSRKINSEEERQRLKRIVTSERENGLGGFIVRTAAANIKEDELRADIRFLKHLWAEIKSRTENSKAPALIYHDLNLVERVLRDQVNADFSHIWVDTEEEYERIIRFANRFQPSLVRRIKLYTKETPLFEQFGIQDEIDKSLKSKVWLKSGGYIVINQTEALVAIDINTGKYVGKTQRLEDTIVKTNIDAIREIVRQVRLRDLGGIIVIDFIDMDERKNRQKVMAALEDALRADRAPSKVLQFNDFGLVAITRKRVKQSLERTLGEPCPYCTGAGFVKSVTTVCNDIYVEMRKMIKEHDRKDITLRVNPEVAKALKANNGKLIGEMEELTGKTVIVKGDPLLHQENFDIH